MDDPAFPLGQILNAGLNGFVAFLIWNLIQTNRSLIAEMRERDQVLVELIHKLVDRNHQKSSN